MNLSKKEKKLSRKKRRKNLYTHWTRFKKKVGKLKCIDYSLPSNPLNKYMYDKIDEVWTGMNVALTTKCEIR